MNGVLASAIAKTYQAQKQAYLFHHCQEQPNHCRETLNRRTSLGTQTAITPNRRTILGTLTTRKEQPLHLKIYLTMD